MNTDLSFGNTDSLKRGLPQTCTDIEYRVVAYVWMYVCLCIVTIHNTGMQQCACN